jgi:hypothetical protein
MICKIIEKYLSSYLDKESSPLVNLLIDRHIKSCSSCKAKLVLFVRISEAAGKKEVIKLSPEFMRNLKNKILEAKVQQASVSKPESINIKMKLAFGVFCFALLAGGLLFFSREKETQINEFATLASQTSAEIIQIDTDLEYSTYSSQTRRW